MSIANPEIFGQPADYIVTPRLLQRTDATLLAQTGAFEFPKSPNFGGAENDDRAELRRAISENKIPLNTPIDLSICSIGQDKEVSAYGKWQIWCIDRNGNDPKPVRDKYFTVDTNINTFFYTGWYGGNTLPNMHTLWARTNYDNGRYFRWSPEAEYISDNSSLYNANMLTYPIVTYGSKSMIGTVWVGIVNPRDLGVGLQWIRLEEWKEQYSTNYIAGIALAISTPYEIRGNFIEYTDSQQNASYGAYQRLSAGLLNQIDGRYDHAMTLIAGDAVFGQTAIMLLNLYSYSDSSIICPEDTRIYIPCDGLFENDGVYWSWEKLTYGGDRIYLYRRIPYSEKNYETIIKMAACFGIPFVVKNKRLRFDMSTGWNDEDLYFPIIDANGVCHGEYTHGNDNLTNPFNDLENVREKNYNPYGGFKIYIGDNQVSKIYVGNKDVASAYLGDNKL